MQEHKKQSAHVSGTLVAAAVGAAVGAGVVLLSDKNKRQKARVAVRHAKEKTMDSAKKWQQQISDEVERAQDALKEGKDEVKSRAKKVASDIKGE